MTRFPAAALSQHVAILGKTGSGKSYTARGIIEELLDAGMRVCIIDPTGAWHGLRSSASGKSAGYPVVIFGGSHADLPLGATHGEAIAEIIGTSGTPAIIDTSLMRVGERTRFFADFADGLIRKNRGPLQLIVDEAHLFAPQGKVNDPASGAMLHAANNLVSLGRSRGLRIILITQRPAKLHKDSLTQVETLVAMRLIAPQDRKAVEEWIKDNADEAKGREIIASLATLKTGQGWVWAPEIGVLERIQFPRIKTFDSGRAPDGSEQEGQVLAPIDRDAIAMKLQAVAADAMANDPAALKKTLAAAQRQIVQLQSEKQSASPAVDTTTLERRCYAEGFAKGQSSIVDQLEIYYASLEHWSKDMPRPPVFKITLGDIPARLERHPPSAPLPRQLSPGKNPVKTGAKPGGEPAELGAGGKRRILTALAQYPGGMNQRKLSILVDIAPKGGTWRTYMAEMRGKGWIDGGRDHLKITEAGIEALGDYEPLPTGQQLIEYWRRRLGDSGKRAIFDVIVNEYPDRIAAERVSRDTGIAMSGGTWRTYMAELRGLGIIEGRDELKASEDLFA
jgi:uncharacterized protein